MQELNIEQAETSFWDTIRQSYKISGKIGKGGYGHVYKAKHRESGRKVAIKLINNI